jgi:hypothetical protein
MLSIEEYIARRKKEDRLNEFNITARIENMKTVIDYVFEYFNNYLDITELDERTALQDEKIKKFYGWVRDYDSNVKEWLLDIF